MLRAMTATLAHASVPEGIWALCLTRMANLLAAQVHIGIARIVVRFARTTELWALFMNENT